MKIIYVLFIAFFISACGSTQTKGDNPSAQKGKYEIPVELKDSVEKSKRVGIEIFERDTAAWKGTDLFLEMGLLQSNPALKGWITEDLGEAGYAVTFIGEKGGHYVGFYRAQVHNGIPDADSYIVNDAGFDLSKDQLSRFKARLLAGQLDFMRCSERYNTVVTGQNSENKTVYLLASSTQHGEIFAGGNHQVLVDPSGDKVIEHLPLSKSCLTMQKQDNAVALTVTHLVSPVPTAVHVFQSLQHDIPFYVLTVENGYIWYVDGDNISIKDKVGK